MRNLPPLAVIVSSTFGRIRLSMMWPAISTSSKWWPVSESLPATLPAVFAVSAEEFAG
jgi:hypothetical protein